MVILTTDIVNNKQYVLSLSDQEIIFPELGCDDKCFQHIELCLIDNIKKYLTVNNELELLPQIINLYPSPTKENSIDIIYGFLVTKTKLDNNGHWYEFSYKDLQTKKNQILFEVTHKLK